MKTGKSVMSDGHNTNLRCTAAGATTQWARASNDHPVLGDSGPQLVPDRVSDRLVRYSASRSLPRELL